MLVLVLFYFEFCEILKTFPHISASRQAFVRRYFEASLCALSGDKYWKVRAKSKSKLDRYSLPVWSKPLAAPDGTDVARECIRRVLFAVVASWVAFISSLSGMNFAQLGFGRKPRNYTSIKAQKAKYNSANRGIILRFLCFYRDDACTNWMLRLFSASSFPFFLHWDRQTIRTNVWRNAWEIIS